MPKSTVCSVSDTATSSLHMFLIEMALSGEIHEKETLIKATISSKKSKNLSSTSKNVAKTYQNLVKYDEPHVKKKL